MAERTDVFTEADRRLTEWGKWQREMSDSLGYPRMTGIRTLIERVKVFIEPKASNAALREARASGDCKRVAQALGYAEPSITAQGKDTRSMRPLGVGHVPRDVMEVDALVATLPNEMHAVISRSYRWCQPDRIAAREMHMDTDHYRRRLRAAVTHVAEKLGICAGLGYNQSPPHGGETPAGHVSKLRPQET